MLASASSKSQAEEADTLGGDPMTPAMVNYKEAVEEWWLIVLTFPILFAFIPGCTPTIARGFQALHLAPLWFQEACGAAIVFAFGRRAVRGLRLPAFGRRKDPAPSTSPAQGAGT